MSGDIAAPTPFLAFLLPLRSPMSSASSSGSGRAGFPESLRKLASKKNGIQYLFLRSPK